MGEFSNKTAIIPGGATKIGAAIACSGQLNLVTS